MATTRPLLSTLRAVSSRRALPPTPASPHTRAFHASPAARDMVAPPDPVSHMRPIIYDGPPAEAPAGAYVRHPYSLAEFQFQAGGAGAMLAAGDNALQFKLERQQLDALHQNFWIDSNTRFYAAKESVLGSLPANATARDKEEALSEFYKQWVMQEAEWTDAYTTEWRSRNARLIALSARVHFAKFMARLSPTFKSS